jgi:hypothetical protein
MTRLSAGAVAALAAASTPTMEASVVAAMASTPRTAPGEDRQAGLAHIRKPEIVQRWYGLTDSGPRLVEDEESDIGRLPATWRLHRNGGGWF